MKLNGPLSAGPAGYSQEQSRRMLRRDELGHAGMYQDVPVQKLARTVCTSICEHILGYTIILVDKTVYTSIYEYILVYTRTEPEMSYDVI